jgi:hypothetical protein
MTPPGAATQMSEMNPHATTSTASANRIVRTTIHPAKWRMLLPPVVPCGA